MNMHKNKRLLFIGLTTIDIQYFINEHPVPNTKVKCQEPFIFVGGPSANAAITASFLGAKSDFVTCVGENPFTQFILSDFTRHRVALFDRMAGKVFSPIIASVFTNQANGDRTILTHHPKTVDGIEQDLVVDLREYSCILIDGFYPELALPLVQLAKESNVPVVLDGGSWKEHLDQLLPYVDIAICSENFYPKGTSCPHTVIEYLSKAGVGQIAITRGPKPIIWQGKGQCGTIQVEKVETIDTLGAGDVFHGAFLYYLSACHSFEDALRGASAIATFSVQYPGTREWMKSFHINSE
jgi:sugar/nucleoside kinase (ribokinase family)